jgi:hypothetical protein
LNDRVEAREVLGLDVANVDPKGRHRAQRRGAEVAVVEQPDVEPADLVALALQERYEDGPDVPL